MVGRVERLRARLAPVTATVLDGQDTVTDVLFTYVVWSRPELWDDPEIRIFTILSLVLGIVAALIYVRAILRRPAGRA